MVRYCFSYYSQCGRYVAMYRDCDGCLPVGGQSYVDENFSADVRSVSKVGDGYIVWLGGIQTGLDLDSFVDNLINSGWVVE